MIDLKAILQPKIVRIDELAQTLLRAFSLVNFQNVTDVINFQKHQAGDFLTTNQTKWIVSTEITSISLNDGLYLKALGDVFVEDFNDGVLTQSEYVTAANSYCMSPTAGNRLIFDATKSYEFNSDTSFDIYVESGGWYCSGNCKLKWNSTPKAGYAIKVLGRYNYGHNYSLLVNNSNYNPLEGFNIGSCGNMLPAMGLCIGHSESLRSMKGAVVTSKFKIERVSVFDFDDVVTFYPGVWACELRQVNTIGGSWQTPFYFNGIDFGESIKLTNCFIADNHRRVRDNELGKVNFNTGEFTIYGCSFNNMRVVVNGDAVVKMNCPHFENPNSQAKNKRFLEVIGSHAYCILDKPHIVIRNTPIYSNLFYCKAGSSQNKHPYTGGLVFISPSYNAAPNYRPDLAAQQGDGVEYESDGYLELVGGGGRVYLEGGAHISSLFHTGSPIPVARNLVNRSSRNSCFRLSNSEERPNSWFFRTNESTKIHAESNSMRVQHTTITDENYTVFQEVECAFGQTCIFVSNYRCFLKQGDITNSECFAYLEYIDSEGGLLDTQSVKNMEIENELNTTDSTWNSIRLFGQVPDTTRKARFGISLKYTSMKDQGKFEVLVNSIIFNVI